MEQRIPLQRPLEAKAPQLEEEIPIVDAQHDFTDAQDNVIKNVHRHIASLIPEIGRDYTVDFHFPNGDAEKVDIILRGKTASGNAFVEVIKNYLEEND